MSKGTTSETVSLRRVFSHRSNEMQFKVFIHWLPQERTVADAIQSYINFVTHEILEDDLTPFDQPSHPEVIYWNARKHVRLNDLVRYNMDRYTTPPRFLPPVDLPDLPMRRTSKKLFYATPKKLGFE